MKSNFQTIILAICLASFVFAVLIFAGLLPIGKTGPKAKLAGNITIWGTVQSIDFAKIIEDINTNNPDLILKYYQKDPATYSEEILQSIATGTGPDLFMLPDDLILKEEKFITPIPYTSYPEKSFRDTFIDGAEVYLGADGIIGLPITVDPLVLYYNKDILSNNGISNPPTSWDELLTLNSTFTKSASDGTISNSMIALGTYDNINHAKEILAMFLIQSGNPIVAKDGDKLVSVFGEQLGQTKSPAESVLEFYSNFSNPTSTLYSWNRGLVKSKDFFTGGKLAFYIGKGSELFNIQSVNPNLSFDVSTIMQTNGTNARRTFASMNAVAISKSTKNPALAMSTAILFTEPEVSKNIAVLLSLPPARRDLLAEIPRDPYLTVFYNSAIFGRTWLDPDNKATDAIFRDMIQNILSNKFDISDSINRAQAQIALLLRK
jgi:ABC-type glycerol-3-phosphate transport system substrate-binding protein